MSTRYAMAMKRSAPMAAPADWYERLARTEGVTVEGHSPRGAQFSATPAGIAKVRADLSDYFVIEEVRERSSK